MNKRQSRFKHILDVLLHNSVGSQEELMEMLKERNIFVTQATLSRDLKTLRTTKVPTEFGGYRYVVSGKHAQTDYTAPLPNDSTRHTAVISIRRTGNIVVIKTRNGYASALAFDIDEKKNPVILGTVAGANTVFVAVDAETDDESINSALASVIPAAFFKKDGKI